MSTLFKTEIDPDTGRKIDWHWDEVEKKLSRQQHEDVQETTDLCKFMRSQKSGWKHFAGDKPMHHVGKIPNIIIKKIMDEHGINPYSGDQDVSKRFYRIIRQEYPQFITTNAKGVL